MPRQRSQKRRCAVYTRKSHRGGAGAGVQHARCPARRLRGLRRQPARRGLGAGARTATTTAASPAARWSGRRCSGCWPTSRPAWSTSSWSTRSTGSVRSLMDFAKLVEVFDAHGVTFVSVTQSFNTTTSMGRLTLNILLSFAQFEREVIGERIRDKFAASRARGMWMGGKVPLGYDVRDRKLVVNEAEAALVRRVFEVFAEIGLRHETVAPALRAEGVTSKARPADRQGRHLQAAEQPDLRRRGGAQGEGLSRRAPGHRAAGAVGPGACHPAGKPAGPGQPEPGADAGAAAAG